MSIPVIEGYTEYGSSGTVTDIVLTKPASVAVGELLLVIVANDFGGNTDQFSDDVTDWNFVGDWGNGTSDCHVGIYWREATGSEGSTLTITPTTSGCYAAGYYARISGVNTTSPLDFTTAGSTVQAGSVAATGDTTSEDDCLAMCAAAFDGSDGYPASTSGTGWSEKDEVNSDGGGAGVSLSWSTKDMATAGATGTCTVTWDRTDGTVGFQFAIAPSTTTVHDLTIQEAAHSHTADTPTLGYINHLTIQEAAHAHAADNLDLGYINHLSINDCDHYHAADPCDVAVSYELVIQEAAHDHIADNLDLGYINHLTIQETLHAHAAENLVLSLGSTLEIDEASHAHQAENLVLGYINHLTIQETLHAHAAENLVLSLGSTLEIDEASHAHQADNLVLTVDFWLVIDDALHGHQVDNLDLTAIMDLTVDDALHGHAADSCNVAVSYLLDIQDCLHGHASAGSATPGWEIGPYIYPNELTITSVYNLTINDALHSHQADNAVLTAIANLSINDTLHSHQADEPNVVLSYTLVIQEAAHDHIADNLDLGYINHLTIQETLHAHAVDNLELTVDLYLQIHDALHGHTAENLSLGLLTTLSIDETLHAHQADNLELASLYILSIDECLHAHSVESLTMQNVYQLSIAECLHDHAADDVVLTSLVNLDPADCWHGHVADQCDVEVVSGAIDLEIQGSYHGHYADTCEPTNVYILSIDECLHAHLADAPEVIHDELTTIYPTIQQQTNEASCYGMALLDLGGWFEVEVRTDTWTTPNVNDTATHQENVMLRLYNVTLPSSGYIDIDIRKTGANELTLRIAPDGGVSLLENGTQRIAPTPGDLSGGGQVTLHLDDDDARLFADDVYVGAWGLLGIISGTTAELMSLGTGGAIGQADFLPVDFPTIPKEL